MPRDTYQPLTLSAFSEDVQEIMSRPPHWLLRWGAILVFSILCLLLIISWLIRYPDIIAAPITLTGSNPPVEVVARQSGHLSELRVIEGAQVREREVLAIIDSPVDAAAIFGIREQLDQFLGALDSDAELAPVEFHTEGQLGKLQVPWSEFYREYLNDRTLRADDYTEKTVAILERQLARKSSQLENLLVQTEAVAREGELAALRYERMKALNARDSVSDAQLQEEESDLLAHRRQTSVVLNQLNEEEIAQAAIEKQIRDLQHQRSEDLRESASRLHEALKRLLSEIEIWDDDFVLRAPIDGHVAFYDFWSGQQYVSAGNQVFVIDPGSNHVQGRVQVKRAGAGKIEPGHRVRVKFDDYPYHEFGLVTGTVRSVSTVAREGAHLVTVDIDYPLTTSFRKQLPFKQEMTGEASVVTRDRRLIERILANLIRAFSQSTSN